VQGHDAESSVRYLSSKIASRAQVYLIATEEGNRMSSRPRKASFLHQNVEMLRGLFLCTVGGRLRCGIRLGAYQAHHRGRVAYGTDP
jgi:hypothetical protein